MPRPPELSARAVALKPSLTLAIGAQAKALQRAGRDICSLSAGEPDFDTPDFIVEATRQALRDGITRYGPAAGDPELRAAVAEKLSSGNGIATSPEQVLITNGGKQAIYNLFQVLLNPGDEVLLPAPYWLSYPEMAALAGAKVKLIPTQAEEGFRLDLTAVEAAITPCSRLLVLNSPGNPTGRVMKRQELEDVAELVRRHPQLLVMSDEIYEFLLAEGEQHHSFAAIAPDLAHRCFTVNGFAKGWAMTGWRLGYLAGHQDVIKAAAALQSQSTSNVCSFAQRGALAAIQGPRDCVSAMAESYNSRRQLLTEGLQAIEGITLVEPRGAFYAFPQLPESAGGSMDFCSRALEQAGLAVVPGLAFGNDRCIRLSCAVSRETIRDGLSRLTQLLDET
ncbi:pyridoxal phosphate-dependent aminotransferase [Synechococcus sp. A15-24]|uniref:pyridoxal phosphate-dependent aminotransferase n=1 Tax=Synechococcus sp. A15-24 TaxID=1050635 RepID=UPI00164843E4|nr:pyridoxal phosphate-dependent aminotransferase [Synechococcus sp. A15-24]QNJ28949.1 aspartate aminotransferase [Synechococcus sp. A15-24]